MFYYGMKHKKKCPEGSIDVHWCIHISLSHWLYFHDNADGPVCKCSPNIFTVELKKSEKRGK